MPIIDLGVQRLTGWTKTPHEPGPEGPLSLVRCMNTLCSLVQLEHTMDADLMWRDADYGYRSSLNPIMIDGTGMCGGCLVTANDQIRFACVDGPVFDGASIDWDELLSRLQTYAPQEKAALNHYCRVRDL